MSSDNVKALFYLALIGGGAYLAWLLYQSLTKAGSAVGTAVTNAQASAASSAADLAEALLGTNQPAQPGQTYTVTMQDGSVQTVPYGQLPTYTPQNSPSIVNGLGRLKIRRRHR